VVSSTIARDVSVHARWVRVSHWILAASVLTLAVSGCVILMAHPRLYWGEAGNDLMPALIELPFTPNSGRVEFTGRAPIFQAHKARFEALAERLPQVRLRHVPRSHNLAGIALQRQHDGLGAQVVNP